MAETRNTLVETMVTYYGGNDGYIGGGHNQQ